MRNIGKTLVLGAVLLLSTSLAHAQLGNTMVTNNVTLTVSNEAALTIGAVATNLTSTGSNFADYTGSTPFTYFIRTTATGGTGFINLQVTTDFAPSGGPSVHSPLTGSDALAYTCTVSLPGTGCSGSVSSSTAATTSVATFGADNHSVKAGNSASVAWDLSNDPLYATGSYQATVTYTIGAL